MTVFYTGGHWVTLNSKAAAGNHNAVVLGSLTQVDGTLVAPSGFLLGSGRTLVSINGLGLVSRGGAGPITSQFLNHGNVQGPDASTDDWLYFDLTFKGSTGLTAGNVAFLGGFSPGDSPAINAHGGNAQLGGTSEFNIGGGNSRHGRRPLQPTERLGRPRSCARGNAGPDPLEQLRPEHRRPLHGVDLERLANRRLDGLAGSLVR